MADEDRPGPPKKYGLILPGKKNAGFAPSTTRLKPKLFDDEDGLEQGDSEEETEAPTDWVAETLKSQTIKKKQLKMTYQKVLEEDPTIYQFDEVYDEIKAQREKQSGSEEKSTEKPKSRYIETLKKAADKRQKEYERRQERRIQKEREEEAGKFEDKEIFVTSAYRKKMEELAADEEEQKRMKREEEFLDVTKQSDLSGFYRHVYREAFDENPVKEAIPEAPKPLPAKSPSVPPPATETTSKKRHYRKREESESPEREAPAQVAAPEADKNLDADSDLDISDAESGEEAEETKERSEKVQSSPKVKKERVAEGGEFKKPLDASGRKPKVKKEEEVADDKENEEPEVKKKKVDVRELFVKRTIGDVFEEAMMRYYQRKAMVISGVKRGLS